MIIKENLPRILGATQLFVFVDSLVSEQLLRRVVGKGDISSILENISNNISLWRISTWFALANSLGIIILGILFFLVFRTDYKTLATIGLVFFIAEGLSLGLSKIGALRLIPLGVEFASSGGTSDPSILELGKLLFYRVDRFGYDIHMLFFCVGGMIWYYLLLVSGIVPKALALWGLIAIVLIFIPVIMVLINSDWDKLMVLGLPYMPFELALSIWLISAGLH